MVPLLCARYKSTVWEAVKGRMLLICALNIISGKLYEEARAATNRDYLRFFNVRRCVDDRRLTTAGVVFLVAMEVIAKDSIQIEPALCFVKCITALLN